MTKIIIAGAGGAPSEGVINSLLLSKKGEEVIGIGSEPTDLILSSAKKKYIVPYANAPEYKDVLINILQQEKPNLIHFQNDLEIYHASLIRDEIHATGVKTFMPSHEVIDTCVHKYKTYLKVKDAGITVPVNAIINNEDDLNRAFKELGDDKGKIWLRVSSIGGGGKGALPTNDFTFAKGWIDRFNGWGDFVAAEMLTPDTVTWLSIWYEGELVVAQTRIRKGWTHGNRTVSGVTGVTKVGQTFSNDLVDKIATDTVKAVSAKPHGIFGVDMAYDKNGIPNPTEINISRFFTTVLFFTKAGLNMPEIFKDIALYNEFPDIKKKINPLADGLLWLRGMDTVPKLMTSLEIEQELIPFKMILVTGSSGFIGKHLLKALIEVNGRENILALTSKPINDCSFLLHNDYDFSHTFFKDAGYENITTVIHAGAFTPKKNAAANDFLNSYSNITSTHRLIQALPDNVERFIFFSTLDVYAITEDKITEDTAIGPTSLYGQSKYYCEKAVEAWANEKNKLIQVLRIGHVYGPGEEIYQKIIPVTIKNLLAGKQPQIWGSGKELRSFIFIEDVVNAVLASLQLSSYIGPVNIVSEQSISINDLVNQLINISDLPVIPDYLNANTNRNIVFNNSKMKNYLCSESFKLADGLKAEWEYMNQLN